MGRIRENPLKQNMATWMMHFRIAEHFRTRLEVDEVPFIVGNIGPDCGEQTGEWGQYNPPSTITHWRSAGNKDEIDAEGFFKEHLANRKELSKKQVSFYIGYYLHLLTDQESSTNISKPLLQKYEDILEQDKKFMWTITKDWYDLEYLYLRENPEFPTFKIFEGIETFPNEYLDYYSDTAMIKQIKYITQFYQKGGENLDREYIYLTKCEVDEFIEKTCQVIEGRLKEKQILF